MSYTQPLKKDINIYLINRKTCHKNLFGTTIDILLAKLVIDQTLFRKRVLLLRVLVILTK